MTFSIGALSKQWLLSRRKQILIEAAVSLSVAAQLFLLLGVSATLQQPGKSLVRRLAKEPLVLESCEEQEEDCCGHSWYEHDLLVTKVSDVWLRHLRVSVRRQGQLVAFEVKGLVVVVEELEPQNDHVFVVHAEGESCKRSLVP